MGLFKAAKDAVGGYLADQWREFFYCDALTNDILAVKGSKRVTNGRNSNKKSADNIISNGSVIAVNEGQCMIIVDQGEIVEFSADPGEFVYDSATSPSLFYGDLGENLLASFENIGRRFAFGGNSGKDQRVYYFNIKEIMGSLFGTAAPVPFRVVDQNIGLDVDISIRCNGEFSYKITDPLLFYKNVCGNVTEAYGRDQLASQMKSELMTALQPAFARISAMGVRYSAIPAHTSELAGALNEVLSEKWAQLRGIQIVSMNINSLKASEEDEQMIKDLQRTAVFQNTKMAAAALTGAQADAMRSAASNTAAGPMMAFAGMNMANAAGGVNAGQLYQMDAQERAAGNSTHKPQPGWTCKCGHTDNRGKFCMECGQPKPSGSGWTCGCGAVNQGKFCTECGAGRPEGAVVYKCDKCGWEPENPAQPPRFCPECGDIFDDGDIK